MKKDLTERSFFISLSLEDIICSYEPQELYGGNSLLVISYFPFSGVLPLYKGCVVSDQQLRVCVQDCKNTERGALLSLSVFSAVRVMKSRRGPSVRGV